MSNTNFKKGPMNSAKNKPKTQEELDKAKVPATDERATVILDEDLDGVEFEERVWLYWKRNKNFIVGTVILAFVLVIGIQGTKQYNKNKEDSLALSYETSTNLEEFAASNSGTQLAGLAFLELADEAYNNAEYAKAAELYTKATDSLSKDNVLWGRAKLGEAMSAHLLKDNAKALDLLLKISNGSDVEIIYKAQAELALAGIYQSEGKIQEAKDLYQKISTSQGYGESAIQATDILSTL